MKKFFGTELSFGGFTSVWVPDRINVRWVGVMRAIAWRIMSEALVRAHPSHFPIGHHYCRPLIGWRTEDW